MSTIIAGSNGTLKTTTAEGQLFEIFTFLQLAENDTAKNTSGRDFVQGLINVNTLIFSGNFSIPVVQTVNEAGSINVVASEYLINTLFAAGDGGTFKSNNPAQYLLEVVSFLQNKERDATKNLQSRDYVTGSLEIDTLLFTGSVTLPLSMALNDSGNPIFTAVEYLG
jgi:hypothetical protein